MAIPTPSLQSTGDHATGSMDSRLGGLTQALSNQADKLLDNGQALADSGISHLSHGLDRASHAGQALSHEWRARAGQARDATRDYVRDEPVKAVLISAAAGAGLMALLGLLLRARFGKPH
jgi:ElaB/YqjD/DUF883 family membrane-anchored ribosome-binding protein